MRCKSRRHFQNVTLVAYGLVKLAPKFLSPEADIHKNQATCDSRTET